jgi:hypothetical protein
MLEYGGAIQWNIFFSFQMGNLNGLYNSVMLRHFLKTGKFIYEPRHYQSEAFILLGRYASYVTVGCVS